MAKATAVDVTSMLALIPTFSDLNPLERRGMLKLKARETRRSLEYELRLVESMRIDKILMLKEKMLSIPMILFTEQQC